MFAQYRLIASLLAIVAIIGGTYTYGHHAGYKSASDAAAAVRLKEITIAQQQYQKEVIRGNALANQLATSEAKIIYRTKEVIKYVPSVTSGRKCLSASAVRLLNSRPDDTVVPKSPSQPIAESPSAPAATDTDVAYWIANTNSEYDTCAARLNSLIDFESVK